MVTRILGVALVATLGLPAAAAAQDLTAASQPTAPPPANLAYVEGDVELEQQGVASRADAPAMLVDGDRLRTVLGRAEVVFADGSLLHVDRDTALEILTPTRLRLFQGRVTLRVSAAATDGYVIDTPASSVSLVARGEYGIAADSSRGALIVSVARGAAEMEDATGRVLLRAGERATLSAVGDRARLSPFNSAAWDAFDRWSNDRLDGFAHTASAQRLPPELVPYGSVLDRYGRWDYLQPYGHVWYPAVAGSWRPYYAGAWRTTRYGWTWYGHDPWAWPTHHYGRWGYERGVWFWIPTKVWGPAWVSWAIGPGYVGWCPLGWGGGPVLGFFSPGHGYGVDPWHAWTVLPRSRFGHDRPLQSWHVAGRNLPDDARRAFVVQDAPPPLPDDFAVPRGTLSVPTARPAPAPPPAQSWTRDRAVPRSGDERRRALRRPPIASPRDGFAVPSAPTPAPETLPPPSDAGLPRQSWDPPTFEVMPRQDMAVPRFESFPRSDPFTRPDRFSRPDGFARPDGFVRPDGFTRPGNIRRPDPVQSWTPQPLPSPAPDAAAPPRVRMPGDFAVPRGGAPPVPMVLPPPGAVPHSEGAASEGAARSGAVRRPPPQ